MLFGIVVKSSPEPCPGSLPCKVNQLLTVNTATSLSKVMIHKEIQFGTVTAFPSQMDDVTSTSNKMKHVHSFFKDSGKCELTLRLKDCGLARPCLG